MKRILFVDDDPGVLEGLRNRLRRKRKEWEMAFALGGPAAIEEMEKGAFDVVVTDMRMPQMDGYELLKYVQANYPKSARIILTGQTDQEQTLRAMPVAHQFLNKPCEGAVLENAVTRACDIQGILENDQVKELVGNIETLPSPPSWYYDLVHAIHDDRSGLSDIAQIVEKDVAFTAKILKVVNSAYFALARTLTNIREACSYLGLEIIKDLVLSVSVYGKNIKESKSFSVAKLQEHSFLSAKIARKLTENERIGNEAYTACILHDAGKLVLFMRMPEKQAECLKLAREKKIPILEVEKEMYGFTHAEVGAYLLGLWGLPFSIVEAVAYHHNPKALGSAELDLAGAVYIASYLANAHRSVEPWQEGEQPEEILDMEYLKSVGCEDQLEGWVALASREAQEMEEAG